MFRPVILSPSRFLRISSSIVVLSSDFGVARFQFEQTTPEMRTAERASDKNAFFIRQPPRGVGAKRVPVRWGGSGSRGSVAKRRSDSPVRPLVTTPVTVV